MDAEADHRGALARLQIEHGDPLQVRTLADVLALDDDYRSRFGGRELLPTVLRRIAPAAGALVGALASVVLLIATR